MNVEGPTRRSLGTAQFGIDDDSNRIMPTYPSVQASHMGTMNKPLRNYIFAEYFQELICDYKSDSQQEENMHSIGFSVPS
ncbi:unnamed protein product [Brugia timori]|uniref:Uncharacterized protein n=1 Tax=Brugia timori TaxID=42155 RepID=A0A0R3QMD4_9BILA|nr:unnamed protein product [Brugia timori]